jgi:hypothetical protein
MYWDRDAAVAKAKDERDAAIRERDAAKARVAELEAASGGNSSAQPYGSTDESGGGEAEPVAWARLRATANPKEFFWCHIEETYGDPDDPKFDLKDGETVVPLYRQPPQPRGWLTEEEREALETVLREAKRTYHSKYDGVIWAVKSLRARSTPPEVVVLESWREAAGEVVSLEDVRAALAAIGVAVKEVGRE